MASYVVDPIGNRLAQFRVREIMDEGLLRLSLRLPLLAAVAVVSHQFLLLGVDGDDRQALLQELLDLRMDILKLSIPIRMPTAFQRLGVGLQTISHLMEKFGHLAVADAIPLPPEFRGKLARALRGPAQERFRVTPSQRLHQLFQGPGQFGMMKGERLTTPSPIAASSRRQGFPLALLQDR